MIAVLLILVVIAVVGFIYVASMRASSRGWSQGAQIARNFSQVSRDREQGRQERERQRVRLSSGRRGRRSQGTAKQRSSCGRGSGKPRRSAPSTCGSGRASSAGVCRPSVSTGSPSRTLSGKPAFAGVRERPTSARTAAAESARVRS